MKYLTIFVHYEISIIERQLQLHNLLLYINNLLYVSVRLRNTTDRREMHPLHLRIKYEIAHITFTETAYLMRWVLIPKKTVPKYIKTTIPALILTKDRSKCDQNTP